jgi:hypothetical protein
VTGSVFENIIIRISASATFFAANAPQRLKKSEVVFDLVSNFLSLEIFKMQGNCLGIYDFLSFQLGN